MRRSRGGSAPRRRGHSAGARGRWFPSDVVRNPPTDRVAFGDSGAFHERHRRAAEQEASPRPDGGAPTPQLLAAPARWSSEPLGVVLLSGARCDIIWAAKRRRRGAMTGPGEQERNDRWKESGV